MTNVEIEDVLSSIRRLVSEDTRGARGAAQGTSFGQSGGQSGGQSVEASAGGGAAGAADQASAAATGGNRGGARAGADAPKLVLTPALRVPARGAAEMEEDPAAAWHGDAAADRAASAKRNAGPGSKQAGLSGQAGAGDTDSGFPSDGDAGDRTGAATGAATGADGDDAADWAGAGGEAGAGDGADWTTDGQAEALPTGSGGLEAGFDAEAWNAADAAPGADRLPDDPWLSSSSGQVSAGQDRFAGTGDGTSAGDRDADLGIAGGTIADDFDDPAPGVGGIEAGAAAADAGDTGESAQDDADFDAEFVQGSDGGSDWGSAAAQLWPGSRRVGGGHAGKDRGRAEETLAELSDARPGRAGEAADDRAHGRPGGGRDIGVGRFGGSEAWTDLAAADFIAGDGETFPDAPGTQPPAEPWRDPKARLLDRTFAARPHDGPGGEDGDVTGEDVTGGHVTGGDVSWDAEARPGAEHDRAAGLSGGRDRFALAASLERTIAELEAAVAGISGEFEGDDGGAGLTGVAPYMAAGSADATAAVPEGGWDEAPARERGAEAEGDSLADDAGDHAATLSETDESLLDEPVTGGLSVSDWTLPWPTTVTAIRRPAVGDAGPGVATAGSAGGDVSWQGGDADGDVGIDPGTGWHSEAGVAATGDGDAAAMEGAGRGASMADAAMPGRVWNDAGFGPPDRDSRWEPEPAGEAVREAGVSGAFGVAGTGPADAGNAGGGISDAGLADAGLADMGLRDTGLRDTGMPGSGLAAAAPAGGAMDDLGGGGEPPPEVSGEASGAGGGSAVTEGVADGAALLGADAAAGASVATGIATRRLHFAAAADGSDPPRRSAPRIIRAGGSAGDAADVALADGDPDNGPWGSETSGAEPGGTDSDDDGLIDGAWGRGPVDLEPADRAMNDQGAPDMRVPDVSVPDVSMAGWAATEEVGTDRGASDRGISGESGGDRHPDADHWPDGLASIAGVRGPGRSGGIAAAPFAGRDTSVPGAVDRTLPGHVGGVIASAPGDGPPHRTDYGGESGVAGSGRGAEPPTDWAHPGANLFEEGEADDLDGDALRDLVAGIIREELQGTLGERITRSVRKLVRREINRMLESRDLE